MIMDQVHSDEICLRTSKESQSAAQDQWDPLPGWAVAELEISIPTTYLQQGLNP